MEPGREEDLQYVLGEDIGSAFCYNLGIVCNARVKVREDMRVIQISKSGYEDGYRAGEKVRGRWERPRTTRLECWVAVVEEVEPLGFNWGAPNASENIRKWTQEDAFEYAAWLHKEKMSSLPDLTVFPELRGMDQYLDDEARGFADGAQIDIREVYLNRYWGTVMWHACGAAPGRGRPLGECTEVVMVGCPGGTVVGKGWDDTLLWYTPKSFPLGPPSREVTVVSEAPASPVRGYRSWGYVNEKGLAIDCGGGAEYQYEAPRDETLFPAPWGDILMASCATVDEAVALSTRYKEYWGPCNSMVVDANGDWALIEKSRHDLHVRRGKDGFAVTTYGGCDSEPMRRLTDTSTGVHRFYERRLARMREIGAAAESAGRLGIEALWEMVLHHDPEAPGCVHADTRPVGVALVCCGCFGTEYRVEDDGTVRGSRYEKTLRWDGEEIAWACGVEPILTSQFVIPAAGGAE